MEGTEQEGSSKSSTTSDIPQNYDPHFKWEQAHKNGCEPSACFAHLQYSEEVFLATELQVIQKKANKI